MAQEIERKFLIDLDDLPKNLRQAGGKKIVQGYVALEEAAVEDASGRRATSTEVRLRRKGERTFLTVKSGDGLVRKEGEIEIDEEEFAALWPFTAGRRVEKVRYALPLGDRLIELDVYEGALQGLATAEIEFPSRAASQDFEPPPWFGEEKTTDPRFKNKYLATHGSPTKSQPM